MSLKPVALPPGRERLLTSPMPTGLPTLMKTIGTVLVWRSDGRGGARSARNEQLDAAVEQAVDHLVGVGLAGDPRDLEGDVSVLDEAGVAQPGPEGLDQRLVVGARGRSEREHADAHRGLGERGPGQGADRQPGEELSPADHCASAPPSMRISLPVMYEESSEAR